MMNVWDLFKIVQAKWMNFSSGSSPLVFQWGWSQFCGKHQVLYWYLRQGAPMCLTTTDKWPSYTHYEDPGVAYQQYTGVDAAFPDMLHISLQ